jgi:UDP-3-O-[3-hydroxymyristoyl] glucosamine N-acyltransferase
MLFGNARENAPVMILDTNEVSIKSLEVGASALYSNVNDITRQSLKIHGTLKSDIADVDKMLIRNLHITSGEYSEKATFSVENSPGNGVSLESFQDEYDGGRTSALIFSDNSEMTRGFKLMNNSRDTPVGTNGKNVIALEHTNLSTIDIPHDNFDIKNVSIGAFGTEYRENLYPVSYVIVYIDTSGNIQASVRDQMNEEAWRRTLTTAETLALSTHNVNVVTLDDSGFVISWMDVNNVLCVRHVNSDKFIGNLIYINDDDLNNVNTNIQMIALPDNTVALSYNISNDHKRVSIIDYSVNESIATSYEISKLNSIVRSGYFTRGRFLRNNHETIHTLYMDNVSIVAWIKAVENKNFSIVSFKNTTNGNKVLIYLLNNELCLQINDDIISVPYENVDWAHLACIISNTKAMIYINGVKVIEGENIGTFNSRPDIIRIGAMIPVSNSLEGYIEDETSEGYIMYLTIYEESLNNLQIEEIFSGGNVLIDPYTTSLTRGTIRVHCNFDNLDLGIISSNTIDFIPVGNVFINETDGQITQILDTNTLSFIAQEVLISNYTIESYSILLHIETDASNNRRIMMNSYTDASGIFESNYLTSNVYYEELNPYVIKGYDSIFVTWDAKTEPSSRRHVYCKIIGVMDDTLVSENIEGDSNNPVAVYNSKSGIITIVWEGAYIGVRSIFYRRINLKGEFLDSMAMKMTVRLYPQSKPTCIIGNDGNLLVTYLADRTGESEVHSYKIIENSTLVPDEVRENAIISSVDSRYAPYISRTLNGYIVIWKGIVPGEENSLFLRSNNTDHSRTQNFDVKMIIPGGISSYGVHYDNTNNVIFIVWEDNSNLLNLACYNRHGTNIFTEHINVEGYNPIIITNEFSTSIKIVYNTSSSGINEIKFDVGHSILSKETKKYIQIEPQNMLLLSNINQYVKSKSEIEDLPETKYIGVSFWMRSSESQNEGVKSPLFYAGGSNGRRFAVWCDGMKLYVQYNDLAQHEIVCDLYYSIFNGLWNHVSVTLDVLVNEGDMVNIRVNGEYMMNLVTSISLENNQWSSKDIYIGSEPTKNEIFYGYISDLHLFRTGISLNVSEYLFNDYNPLSIDLYNTSLIGYWKLGTLTNNNSFREDLNRNTHDLMLFGFRTVGRIREGENGTYDILLPGTDSVYRSDSKTISSINSSILHIAAENESKINVVISDISGNIDGSGSIDIDGTIENFTACPDNNGSYFIVWSSILDNVRNVWFHKVSPSANPIGDTYLINDVDIPSTFGPVSLSACRLHMSGFIVLWDNRARTFEIDGFPVSGSIDILPEKDGLIQVKSIATSYFHSRGMASLFIDTTINKNECGIFNVTANSARNVVPPHSVSLLSYHDSEQGYTVINVNKAMNTLDLTGITSQQDGIFGGFAANLDISERFTIGGVENPIFRVKVDEGFIGINTRNPEAHMHVEGNMIVSSNIQIEGLLKLGENANIETSGEIRFDDILINGNLNVDGGSVFNSNVDFMGNVFLSNAVIKNVLSVVLIDAIDLFASNMVVESLSIDNNAIISSDLQVLKNVYVESNVYLSSDISVSENAYFGSNVNIENDLSVSNNAYFVSNVNIGDDLYVIGNINVGSNVNIENDLSVSNNAYFVSKVNIGNNLSVTRNAYFTSNVYIENDLSVEKNVYLASNVYVKENLYTDKDVNIGSNLYIKGELSVENDVYFESDVYIVSNGYISNYLSIGDNVFISSNVYIENDLSVANDAYFVSNVYIEKELEVKNTYILEVMYTLRIYLYLMMYM